MKVEKHKSKQSAETLYSLIVLLLDEPKKQKELGQLANISESYLSRIISSRNDIFTIRPILPPIPLGESRQIIDLKINEYLSETLEVLNFSEYEKARIQSIFQNNRPDFAKKLNSKKEVYLNQINLNPDNFLNDPFWLILSFHPIRFKSQLYEDFCQQLAIEKTFSSEKLGFIFPVEIINWMKKLTTDITEDYKTKKLISKDPLYSKLKKSIEEEE